MSLFKRKHLASFPAENPFRAEHDALRAELECTVPLLIEKTHTGEAQWDVGLAGYRLIRYGSFILLLDYGYRGELWLRGDLGDWQEAGDKGPLPILHELKNAIENPRHREAERKAAKEAYEKSLLGSKEKTLKWLKWQP